MRAAFLFWGGWLTVVRFSLATVDRRKESRPADARLLLIQ